MNVIIHTVSSFLPAFFPGFGRCNGAAFWSDDVFILFFKFCKDDILLLSGKVSRSAARLVHSRDWSDANNVGSVILSAILRQDQSISRQFHVLETDEPCHRLTLTPTHLVFVMNNSTNSSIRAMFASYVKLGQWLLVVGNNQLDHLIPARLRRVYVEKYEGSYAPITSHGTIIVDWVLASCYAVIEDHDLAHWVFTPVRLWHSFLSLVGIVKELSSVHQADGVHWYPELLYHVASWLLDRSFLHPQT
uniref:Sonic hedgehog signaling molecule b n=1 Tax=Stegastes partitus TaxID=144197 RepID=A0A3B4ZNW9_9TELE